MAKTILTTSFRFSIPIEKLKQIMPEVAPEFSEIPGCRWKIWLMNEDKREGGGVYLFESSTEMDQFLKSDLFALVANNPAFSNVQTNTFSVVEAASVITHAPLLKMDVQWQIPAPFSTAATGSASVLILPNSNLK